MSELFTYNRLKFNKKKAQRNFILKAEKILNLTDLELSNKLGISRRTIYEWKNERITISQIAAIKISKWSNISIPKNHQIIDWRLHFQKAGKIGGRNRFNIYGNVAMDENYRKEKWRQWWNMIGQHKKVAPGFQSLIKIKIPRKNQLLAEFVGIMLGDGGISKYHTTITLYSKEKQYISFVSKVINKLFNLKPKIYKLKYANAVDIVVNRKKLVDFCQTIGLVIGNKIKQQIDIPLWIKKNKGFSRACIKGLIDTDGCFYNNSYYVNGKKYSYLKIAFTSASLPLVNSVAQTLINIGINARISKDQRDVRIENSKYVFKYIKEIGTHNHKHLEKIKKWKNRENVLE